VEVGSKNWPARWQIKQGVKTGSINLRVHKTELVRTKASSSNEAEQEINFLTARSEREGEKLSGNQRRPRKFKEKIGLWHQLRPENKNETSDLETASPHNENEQRENKVSIEIQLQPITEVTALPPSFN
jgi:hypothetical protein